MSDLQNDATRCVRVRTFGGEDDCGKDDATPVGGVEGDSREADESLGQRQDRALAGELWWVPGGETRVRH